MNSEELFQKINMEHINYEPKESSKNYTINTVARLQL